MIIDHTRRLHVGIADGRADKLESALFQISAHRVGFRGAGRVVFQRAYVVNDRMAVDKKPDILVEAAELLLHVEKFLRVVDRSKNLGAVSYDAGIAEQSINLAGAKARDFFRIETGEGAAIRRTLAQYGIPAKPRLSPFQN